MRRFFFHLTESPHLIEDEEGVVLADEAAAVAFAIRQIRDIVAHDLLASGDVDLDRVIDVVSDDGATCCRLAFDDAISVRGYKRATNNPTNVG